MIQKMNLILIRHNINIFMNLNSPKFRSKIKRVLFLTSGWVIASIYIIIIQGAPYSIEFGKSYLDSHFLENAFVTILEVLITGLILAFFEVFYFTDRFKNRSFGFAVVAKSIFYATTLMFLVFTLSFTESIIKESYSSGFFKNIIPSLIILLITWTPVFLISIFILQVSDKYGQGVLLKFILGKYHSPKEETRIFMFLDLKSSTSIAEALGNVKYYEFINDFFYDVTDAIIETKGEIYQYVGDEIVISWNMNNGINDSNCLNCFFNIQNEVKSRSEKYQSKYGLVPSFKAGLHYGEVTVGEIGVLKREIIFSGDVLNTTARIQELCNKYNERLILSKDILDLINIQDKFVSKKIGQINLRGREAPVILFSIKKNM
jgi:adenylate cyclase